MSTVVPELAPTFQPLLGIGDPLAEYWLRQTTLRLRREISWLWYQRGGEDRPVDRLPPLADPLTDVLDQTRFTSQRTRFFAEDPTAAYLSERLTERPPELPDCPARGSFSWVSHALDLQPLDQFLLALTLCPAVDSTAGTVFTACQGNPSVHLPTLALAQRLWDEPEEVLAAASPSHPFFAYGIFSEETGHAVRFDAPLIIPPEIVQTLVARRPTLPSFLVPLEPCDVGQNASAQLCAGRLRVARSDRGCVVPIMAEDRQPLGPIAAGIAAMVGRSVATVQGLPDRLIAGEGFPSRLMTLAWLHGVDLYTRYESHRRQGADGMDAHLQLPLPPVPIILFVGLNNSHQLKHLPNSRLPTVVVEPGTYAMRLQAWHRHLPGAGSPRLADTVRECARRFRIPVESIAEICAGLVALDRLCEPSDLIAACRSDLDLGDLAQPVRPRFTRDDLVLPPAQAAQFDEILRALDALGTVHHEWGTAGIWNESGLSALFAGPPGTGKTMAAEVIAAASQLPLFRVDLSQVVNKYIGETEKNLRKLFDAAEERDVIIFFDEADALFGKRTEVKDAHDRYANLEVSYLLERMERFKGLAILATNRKKDLDEAFLRRLRFVIDFPLPGEAERMRIWRRSIPPGVTTDGVDFAFLAARFPVAGGHIRSIVFNACLQSARPGGVKSLSMEALVAAVKREHDKLDRGLSLEKFGRYAELVKKIL